MERILAQFATLSGITLEEALQYVGLVEACAAEMRASLTDRARAPENAERAVLLCAANACYKYTLFASGQVSGRVTLGDVSVAAGGGEAQLAKAAYDEILASCADLVRDRTFLFGQIS